MSMIRCSANEHYFDNTKHSQCPFCTNAKGNNDKTSIATPRGDDEKTRSIERATTPPIQQNYNNTKEDPKTIAPWQRKKAEEVSTPSANTDTQKTNFDDAPVVGWLVIIEGNGKGRDFRIIPHINTIGRDKNNTICIDTGDMEISRERHSIIEFDTKNSKFYLERGSTTTYLNDNRVGGDGSELMIGDIIEIGSTKLKFIPFCSTDFCWEM